MSKGKELTKKMKSIIVAMVLLAGLFKCGGSEECCVVPSACTEVATVTDFTGLDGCGLMLVLEDGTRLNPERRQYVQAPKQEDDPLYYFTLKAGDRLKIAYRDGDGADACMAGKRVFITCITKIEE